MASANVALLQRLPRSLRDWAAGQRASYALFTLPAVLLISFVVLLPAVLTFAAAFTDWDGVSSPRWVGVDNFRDLLTDVTFWRAVANNVRWTILFLTIPAVMALVVASLLLTRRRTSAIYQILFLLGYALSPIANTAIWRYMVFDHVSGVVGFLNDHGIAVADPLGHVHSALYAVAAVDIWHFWGYLTVVFFAAMRQVPTDQLEAATLDGANAIQIFFYITLPNILPTIGLMFVLVTIFSFLTFDYVYLMTGGGPAHATEILSTLGYGFAFRTFEVGKAAAVALFMCLFGLIAACAYVWMSRESLQR
jgi:raffinose/stachyose/melibiose transport system permease protein